MVFLFLKFILLRTWYYSKNGRKTSVWKIQNEFKEDFAWIFSFFRWKSFFPSNFFFTSNETEKIYSQKAKKFTIFLFWETFIPKKFVCSEHESANFLPIFSTKKFIKRVIFKQSFLMVLDNFFEWSFEEETKNKKFLFFNLK